MIVYRRRLARGEEGLVEPEGIRRREPVALANAACVPLLIAERIVVILSGMGGVQMSHISGTLPGTLYSGVHFVTPLIETVQTYDLRDKLFTTGAARVTRRWNFAYTSCL